MNGSLQEVVPLVLGDGTRINMITGSVIKDEPCPEPVFVPSTAEIIRLTPAVSRRLADLPVSPRQMNAISIVIGYTMLGVSDEMIAQATNIELAVIQKVKESDGYIKVFDEMVLQIVESDKEYVRNLFVSGSKLAAKKVLTLVESPNEATAITAAKDILDRGGHRPADVIDHRHMIAGSLRIEIVKKQGDRDIPHIELEHGDF